METLHRKPLAVACLLTLMITACAPKADSAGGAESGSGAGVPAEAAGITATPMPPMAKFDYGTQHSVQGGQLQWTNAATGAPAATAEYACSTEHAVAIDSAAAFKAEPAGSCPDGKQFYKFSW